MAKGTLNALDQFIVDKTGIKMGFLYQDLYENYLSVIHDYCQHQKAKIRQNAKTELANHWNSHSRSITSTTKTEEKDPSSIFIHMRYISNNSDSCSIRNCGGTTNLFKQDMVQVFSTLFSKSKPRGLISWAAFEAAMAGLKFSDVPSLDSYLRSSPLKIWEYSIEITYSIDPTIHGLSAICCSSLASIWMERAVLRGGMNQTDKTDLIAST